MSAIKPAMQSSVLKSPALYDQVLGIAPPSSPHFLSMVAHIPHEVPEGADKGSVYTPCGPRSDADTRKILPDALVGVGTK